MPLEEPGTGKLGQAGPNFLTISKNRFSCCLGTIGIGIVLLLLYWLYVTIN